MLFRFFFKDQTSAPEYPFILGWIERGKQIKKVNLNIPSGKQTLSSTWNVTFSNLQKIIVLSLILQSKDGRVIYTFSSK